MSEELKARIIRLRKEGIDPVVIAETVDRPLGTVRCFLSEYKAGRDNYYPLVKDKVRRKWRNHIVKEWVRLYKEEKWTQRRIAEHYGTLHEVVCVMIRDYSIEEELWKD
jgi:hypothetical protein